MLTIREIEANEEGKRVFEINDEGNVSTVVESAYKAGKDENGDPIMKPVIFLPKNNSVNQLGVALSKFDAKNVDGLLEVSYRQSVHRSSTTAPQSSKFVKYATDEQKARIAELEQLCADRKSEGTATEEDIEAYKIAMAEYNLAQAYAKRDGVECTAIRPRNPQSNSGSFVDLLTAEEYSEFQAIITACEEAKKNAPKASRKLSDEEKIARKEKAIADKKAEFLAKYGRQL